MPFGMSIVATVDGIDARSGMYSVLVISEVQDPQRELRLTK